MPLWSTFDRRFNPIRLSYARLAGGALWFALLLSLLLRTGKFDLAGQVVGTDYVQFNAVGSMLLEGESARLYHFEYQKKLEQDIVGKTFGGHHGFYHTAVSCVGLRPFFPASIICGVLLSGASWDWPAWG